MSDYLYSNKKPVSDYQYFHDDILISILKHLPPKPLIKFLTVSKSWYSLITNPIFISYHFHHHSKFHNQNRHDLFLAEPTDDYYGYYSICHHGENLAHRTRLSSPCTPTGKLFSWVAGSCNGVICLYDLSCTHEYDYPTLTVCLWNPSINKHLIMEPTPNINCHRIVLGVGFDYVTNDYKVVAICSGYALLFSLLAGSWKKVQVPERVHPRSIKPHATSVSGVIYWVMSSYVNDNDYGDSEFIYDDEGWYHPAPALLTFNVGEEVFGELAPPPGLAADDSNLVSLSVIGSSLCMLHLIPFDSNYVVWQMKEESWTLLFRIKFDFDQSLLSRFFPHLLDDNWTVGDVIIESSGSLISLDEESSPATSLMYGNPVAFSGKAFSYTESLVLLDRFNEPVWMKKRSQERDERA